MNSNTVFKTVATPIAKHNTGKQKAKPPLTIQCRANAVGWYRIFRDMALECPDFQQRRRRK